MNIDERLKEGFSIEIDGELENFPGLEEKIVEKVRGARHIENLNQRQLVYSAALLNFLQESYNLRGNEKDYFERICTMFFAPESEEWSNNLATLFVKAARSRRYASIEKLIETVGGITQSTPDTYELFEYCLNEFGDLSRAQRIASNQRFKQYVTLASRLLKVASNEKKLNSTFNNKAQELVDYIISTIEANGPASKRNDETIKAGTRLLPYILTIDNKFFSVVKSFESVQNSIDFYVVNRSNGHAHKAAYQAALKLDMLPTK
jgi:hypothetical protein